MSAQVYYGQAENRLDMLLVREQIGDGVSLSTRDPLSDNCRRIDGKFTLNAKDIEIAAMIEDRFYSEQFCYIKNTTGSSISAGALLVGGTTLTAAGNALSVNLAAGSSIVVALSSVTGTIEVGSLVKLVDSVSPNAYQYTTITNISGSNYTFASVPYAMTTPSVFVIPAMVPSLATNASGGHASWIATKTIANNAYGFVYGAAKITGLDTSGYSAVGSNVYLGTGGAATPTAPTASTTTVQLVGKVIVKDASIGVIQFYPWRRENTKISSSGLQPGVGLPSGVAAGDLLIDQGSGNAPTFNAMSGDATINSTGVLTVANLAITNAKIAASTIDLTTKVTGILPSANGGTANAFTTFSGPTTSSKTFTLPNASCSLLTTNAAVTVAQGGTGLTTLTAHSVQVGNGTSSPTQLAVPASGTLLQGVASSDPAFTATPTLGVAGTTQGKLTLAGSTSGTCELSTNVAAGTSTKFVLPNTNGTSAFVLQTDGSGNTSWVANAAQPAQRVRQTAKIATISLLSISNGGADASYRIGANVRITASSSFSITVGVTYTDETGASVTTNIPFVQSGSTTGPVTILTNTLGVGAYSGTDLRIRVKASSNIVMNVSGTFGSVTYNAEGVIFAE